MADQRFDSTVVRPLVDLKRHGWNGSPFEPPGRNTPAWPAWPAWRPHRVLYCGSVAVALLVGAVLARTDLQPSSRRVLPGEFERHDLLLVAWPTNSSNPNVPIPELRRVIADIAHAVEGSIDVAVLTIDERQRQAAARYLSASGIATNQLRFWQAPCHTIWVRDYGPFVVKSFEGSGCETLNTDYRHSDSPSLNDVPIALNGQLGWPLVDTPILMENGNLLSNGAGLCVTTEKLFFDNTRNSEPRSYVASQFREYMGAEQVVSLENLIGEPTGHVDMFMTFTAPDTVIVGAYSPAYDPENAAILDRNAQRLSELKTACGPLQVHRIPMPRRPDGRWRTFTNIVLANGVLIVPTFGEAFQGAEDRSLEVYRRVLPNWRIASIDCSDLAHGNGGLHCMTMNVYRVAGNSLVFPKSPVTPLRPILATP